MKMFSIKRWVVFAIAIVLIQVSALTVYAVTVNGTPQNYYGLTTVYTSNSIVENGPYWSASHGDYTSPSRSMDQFGKNVWTTYCTCDGAIMWPTYVSFQIQNNPWMMMYNVTNAYDSMAKSKADCGIGAVLKGRKYIQHWWQDSGNQGKGITINQWKTMTPP